MKINAGDQLFDHNQPAPALPSLDAHPPPPLHTPFTPKSIHPSLSRARARARIIMATKLDSRAHFKKRFP